MAIDFPTSPTPNQLHTAGSRSWTWNNSVGAWYAVNAGVQGIQGIQGAQGTQGLQGITGSQGTQGTQGSQGIQGTQGTQGIQGIQGTQGTQGIQGTQGTQGIQGIQGTQGTQGLQGIQGIQGITGTQGAIGSQGTQGTQGLQGTQGISGASILGTNNNWTGINTFTYNGSEAIVITGTSAASTSLKIVNSNYAAGNYWHLANDSQGGFTLNKNGSDLFFIGRTGTTAASFAGALSVTGTLSTTGLITQTATNTYNRFIRPANTNWLGNQWMTGATAEWFFGQRNTSDSSLHWYDEVGAADKMVLSTTGLVVTGSIRTSDLLLEKIASFTPTTVGWYRIANVGGSGGGLVRISGNYDNTITDVELQFNIGGYGTDGSIQQTRYASYNGGAISQARISSDGGFNCYLDIYISTAGSPAAMSLYFYGPKMQSPVASPVVGAVVGSTNVRTLSLGHGFRTTNGSNFAETSGNVGIGTASPGNKFHVLGTSNDTISTSNTNVRFEAGGGNGVGFGTIASSPYTSYIQSGYLPNFATAVYPLSINPNGGNVAIGSISTSFKLEVTGTVGKSGRTVPSVAIQSGATSGTPAAVQNGDLWWNTDTGVLNIWYSTASAWIAATPVPDSTVFYRTSGGNITGNVAIQGLLSVTGNIQATGTITGSYSDERLKDVSGNIKNALSKVMLLNGVEFKPNDTAKYYGFNSDESEVGVIAQQVQAVLPEVVKPAPFDSEMNDDGVMVSKSGENYITVQYERMVPLLIEAIKEQQAQIEKLNKALEKFIKE